MNNMSNMLSFILDFIQGISDILMAEPYIYIIAFIVAFTVVALMRKMIHIWR